MPSAPPTVGEYAKRTAWSAVIASSVDPTESVPSCPTSQPAGRRAAAGSPPGGRGSGSVALVSRPRGPGRPIPSRLVEGAVELERSPTLTADELCQLYRSVGWVAYLQDPATLSAAMAGSSHVVAARRDGRLVGLARVITDGVSICYLQDVLVEPGLHRTGIGRALVTAVLQPYGAVRQKVLLTDAEPGQRQFYESLGFQETHDVPGGSLRAFVRVDHQVPPPP